MHIVITGASSGIGAAFARDFSRRGHTLTLVARRADLLEKLAAECSGKTHIAIADLGNIATCTDFLAPAITELGPVDVLVNNAGIQMVGPTASVDVDAGDRLLNLNLSTPLRLTRALLPSMLERKMGTIVDIASMVALAPTPGMTYYNASKAGLAAASESLRGELRGSGVHVVTVYPGIIPSTVLAQAALEKFKSSRMLAAIPTGTEERLAELVYDAIVEKRPRIIYPVSGALARWFPGPTRWFMDTFSPKVRALP